MRAIINGQENPTINQAAYSDGVYRLVLMNDDGSPYSAPSSIEILIHRYRDRSDTPAITTNISVIDGPNGYYIMILCKSACTNRLPGRYFCFVKHGTNIALNHFVLDLD